MMARAPPKAPTGMPPPITLPKVARSGAMPVSSAAPPRPTRKPEITSSKISSAPCARVRWRSAARNSRRCSSRPWLAGTGSMMSAAMRAPSRANKASAAASSSSGSTRVQAVNASGTPADEGRPKVARPEPAATSR